MKKWWHVSLENCDGYWLGNGLVCATDEKSAVELVEEIGLKHSLTTSVYEVSYFHAAPLATEIIERTQ